MEATESKRRPMVYENSRSNHWIGKRASIHVPKPSELPAMYPRVTWGTERDQVLLGIITAAAPKFGVVNL